MAHRHNIRSSLIFLLLSLLLGSAQAITVGDSSAKVREEMGRPVGELSRGDVTILLYGEGEVFIRDDAVIAIKPRPQTTAASSKGMVVKVVPDEAERNGDEAVEEKAQAAPPPLPPPVVKEEEPWPPPGISSRRHRKMLRAGKPPEANPQFGRKMDVGEKMPLR